MPRLSNPPDAAILCGGLGTRLRAALPGLPKALAPVHGRPFLDLLLGTLEAAGVGRIVLCIGAGGGAVRQFCAGRASSAAIAFSEEPQPRGTGGALALARPQLGTDPVLVLNGDSIVLGLDYAAFLASHRGGGTAASLVVVARDGRGDAGTITLDRAGRVAAFAEKAVAAGAAYHNAGVYLLGQALLAAIPSAYPLSLERGLMPQWVERGLHAYLHPDGKLVDIGTPERLRQAQAQL